MFGGQSDNLNKDLGATSDLAGYASGLGKKDTSTASKFWSDILKGDASKTAQVLAPEIGAAKKSLQQDQKTAAAFGTRSGGTAGATAASGDKIHSDITSMEGNLTGIGAQTLGNLGGNLLSTSLTATEAHEKFSQDQVENWSNSILGKGLAGGAAFGESFGLSSIPGAGKIA